MDKNKDMFFRIAGIVGLASMLGFNLWMQNRNVKPTAEAAVLPVPDAEEGDHGLGRTTADHGVVKSKPGKEHDHADPTAHGNSTVVVALKRDEGAKKPSGKVADGVREVVFAAFRYGFTPNPLVVYAGEKVRLKLTSRDVKHGVMIPAIDFNAGMNPGKGGYAIFTAPAKPGKYPIFCSVFCGNDHGSMTGSLLVLPKLREKEHGH